MWDTANGQVRHAFATKGGFVCGAFAPHQSDLAVLCDEVGTTYVLRCHSSAIPVRRPLVDGRVVFEAPDGRSPGRSEGGAGRDAAPPVPTFRKAGVSGWEKARTLISTLGRGRLAALRSGGDSFEKKAADAVVAPPPDPARLTMRRVPSMARPPASWDPAQLAAPNVPQAAAAARKLSSLAALAPELSSRAEAAPPHAPRSPTGLAALGERAFAPGGSSSGGGGDEHVPDLHAPKVLHRRPTTSVPEAAS